MVLILLISFFILGLVYFFPLRIELEYRRQGKDDFLRLNFFIFFNLRGLSIRIPFMENRFFKFFTEFMAEVDSTILHLWPGKQEIELEKEIHWEEVSSKRLEKFLKLMSAHQDIFNILSGLKLKCELFLWKTEFGVSNPAYTGMLNGLLWTVKGAVISIIDRKVCKLKDPQVEISPDFTDYKLKIEFKGIFSLWLGNIILTGLRTSVRKLKGGSRIWENIRLKN